MPNLSGEATREAKEASVFFVTYPDAHSSEPATVEIKILKDGKPLNRMSTTSKQIDGQKTALHLASFPLGWLPDGSYQVIVTLRQGGKTTSTSTAFTLAGGQPDQESEGATSNLMAPSIDASLLPPAITFSTGSVEPPPKAQIRVNSYGYNQWAIKYGLGLPNLICIK